MNEPNPNLRLVPKQGGPDSPGLATLPPWARAMAYVQSDVDWTAVPKGLVLVGTVDAPAIRIADPVQFLSSLLMDLDGVDRRRGVLNARRLHVALNASPPPVSDAPSKLKKAFGWMDELAAEAKSKAAAADRGRKERAAARRAEKAREAAALLPESVRERENRQGGDDG